MVARLGLKRRKPTSAIDLRREFLQSLPDSERRILANSSCLEVIARMPERIRNRMISEWSPEEAERLHWSWWFQARPKQLPPEGDWSTWLVRAGRGFGKTRAETGWGHERAIQYPGRWIALVARTPADARDFLIEGPGGFLRNTPPHERPKYEVSKRRLTWPNGSWATIFSDEEPDQLRGFSGDTAIFDEFGKFKNPEECWSNCAFGMREASTDRPRRMIGTTPRPIEILKKIEAQRGTITVTGSSYENRSNLDPSWFEDVIIEYEGTRLGKQEIWAGYIEEFVGAFWNLDLIDSVRIGKGNTPDFSTTVVALDPSGASEEDKQSFERAPKNDEIGIIVGSLGVDNRCYLRDDLSIVGPPEVWGKRAIAAYYQYEADHILAETNFGGDMVAYVIRSIDPNVPVRVVSAAKGKHVRAEPIATLYDRKRDGVRHVGHFPKLEDQLCKFTSIGYQGTKSPDRADAWIWLVTDLALAGGAHQWIEYYRRLNAQAQREMDPAQAPPPAFGYTVTPQQPAGIAIRVPEGISQIYGIDGRTYTIGNDRIVVVPKEDAIALKQRGWEQVS
jgi:phage terminase large subunit-like protein